MVLHEIAQFTPSAVVSCGIIIIWVLLIILVFIYHQIIIVSKYNICIKLCFVLFLIFENIIGILSFDRQFIHTYIHIYIFFFFFKCINIKIGYSEFGSAKIIYSPED